MEDIPKQSKFKRDDSEIYLNVMDYVKWGSISGHKK